MGAAIGETMTTEQTCGTKNSIVCGAERGRGAEQETKGAGEIWDLASRMYRGLEGA